MEVHNKPHDITYYLNQNCRMMERYSKQLASLICMLNVYVLLLLSTKLFHQNKNTRYFDLENKVRCFNDTLQSQFILPNVNHPSKACKLKVSHLRLPLMSQKDDGHFLRVAGRLGGSTRVERARMAKL